MTYSNDGAIELIRADAGAANPADETGRIVACAEKEYMGTHGHYRGFSHYIYCEKHGRLRWTGEMEPVAKPDGRRALRPWTDEPLMFRTLREFKKHYGIGQGPDSAIGAEGEAEGRGQRT